MRPLARTSDFQQNSHTVAIMQQRRGRRRSAKPAPLARATASLAVENLALRLKSSKEPVQSHSIAN
jgi:hypothetical protein